MASLKFPDTGTRLVLINGRNAANATAYLYAHEDLSGPAEVYYDDNGTKGDLIPLDADGRRSITLDGHGRQVDYWGPVDDTDRLWVVVNGVKNPVDADYNSRIDTVATDLAELAAVVGAGDEAALAVHAADTTDVHGIADTELLETAVGAQEKVDEAYELSIQRTSHVGTQSADTLTDGTANKTFSAAESTKLAGIATGATANASDAALRARSSHTGTQAHTTITGLGDSATLDVGATTGTVAAGDDSRLTDARTPSAHAASHASAGSDPITVVQSQVTGLSTTLAAKADLVDGVIPTSQIPPSSSTFLGEVASEAAMLALDGEKNDWCSRTDTDPDTSWIIVGEDPTLIGSWTQFSSVGAVSSVNGQSGTIVLGPADVGAAPSTRTISTTTPLTGGGALSADRTIGVSNATTGAVGVVQLAGDLAGTATAPVIAASAVTSSKILDGTIVNADINASAAIAQSKVFGLTTDLAAKVGVVDYWINVQKSAGIAYDGTTDDSAAFRALLATIPPAAGNEIGGVGLYFPHGVMLLNTPDGDGYLASIVGKPNVKMLGTGAGSRIRTSTATAEELLRVETSTNFNMQDIMLQVIGTAHVKQAFHYTTGSPGSSHFGRFSNVTISCNGSYRIAGDVSCTSGSPTIYSALAEFAVGDIGGFIMIDLSNGPFTSTIQSVATLTGTLAAGITSSATTVTLTDVIAGAPASGFTIKVGNERMFVSAGGSTTTLTVARGRGPDVLTEAHTAGDSVTTYRATLADNATQTISNSVAPARIQPVGSAVMENGYCIGIDHPGASNLDVANTNVVGLAVIRAAVAGVRVGNGTSGNNLDHWGSGVSVLDSGYGIFLNAGSFNLSHADFDNNLIDIRRFGVCSSPAGFEDIRSESSYGFYSYTGSATTGPPTELTKINIVTCYAEDGVPLRHLNSGSLTIKGFDVSGSPTVRGNLLAAIAGTAASPCHLEATNVCHSGGTGDFFASVGVGIPGVRTCVKEIKNQSRKTANGVVEINTVSANYTGGHQMFAGGFGRRTTTVSDSNYTALRTDMSVYFTSLTAARVVTLPAQGNTLPAGQEVTIGDETGLCSPTKTITIVAPSGGTINGNASVVIKSPYGKVTLYTNGTQWFLRGSSVFEVNEAPLTPLRYGAVGDATTLDDAAFAKMFADLPAVGGHVYLPSRYNFRLSQALALRAALRIQGGDCRSALITNTVSDVFTVSGSLPNMHFHDFGVVAGASDGSTGGTIFNLGAVGGSEGVSQTTFRNLYTLQRRPDRSTMTAGVYLDCRMYECDMSSTNNRSVPALHYVSTTGSLSDNTWRDFRHTDYGGGQSTWAMWLEEFSGTTALNNKLHQLNFERPSGGAINLIGQNGTHLDMIELWDMDQVSVNHGIQLGRHVGGRTNIGVLIEGVARPGGTLGAGKADIYSAFDGSTGTTVQRITTDGSQAIRVDLSFAPGSRIVNCYGANAGPQSYLPSMTTIAGAGTGATVTRTGNYDDGVITLTTGTSTAAGDIVKATWPNGLRSAPAAIQLTPMSANAADAGLWVSAVTAGDFTVASANALPASTAGVKFAYSVKRAVNG